MNEGRYTIDVKKIIGLFNFKLASIAGVLMGGLIFTTQYYTVGEIWPATTAAIKQFTYTTLASVVLILIVESVVTATQQYKYCAFYGWMAAWTFTSIMSAIVHSLKGTANPIDAIIINILAAPPGLIIMAYRKKKLLRKEAATQLQQTEV